MPHDLYKHYRRSVRLKGYDYTQPGAYFVTSCTKNRTCLFGEVVDGVMRLNDLGRIVSEEWFRMAHIRRNVELAHDEFVVMPNHIHGIIHIVGVKGCLVGARRRRAPTRVEGFGRPVPGSLPTIVRAFKSAVSRRINQYRGTPEESIWQPNYYEHVIRNEDELETIRQYISLNPLKWDLDEDNPIHYHRDH